MRIDLLYKKVNIATAPVCPQHSGTILGKRFVIGELNTFNGIGVKIIVEMYAVNIVAAYNIVDYLADKFPVFGEAGVKIEFASIFDKPLRVLSIDMAGR